MAQLLYLCKYCINEFTEAEFKRHRQNQYDDGKCYNISQHEQRYNTLEDDYEK